MSQDKFEVVRKHIDAYRRDDVSATLSFLDPHVVLDPSRVGDPEPAYGSEALVRAVRRYVGALKDYANDVKRLELAGTGPAYPGRRGWPLHSAPEGERGPQSQSPAAFSDIP